MKKQIFILLLLSHSFIYPEAKSAKDQWFEAVYEGDLKKIESLLAAGEDIKQTDEYDKAALEIAVIQLANDKLVEILLQKGADVLKKSSGGITLLDAAQSNVDLNDILLEATEKEINNLTKTAEADNTKDKKVKMPNLVNERLKREQEVKAKIIEDKSNNEKIVTMLKNAGAQETPGLREQTEKMFKSMFVQQQPL